MNDDDIDEDLRILEALEAIPEQSKTDLERKHKERRKWGRGGKKAFREGDRGGGQEAFIDLYNRLARRMCPAARRRSGPCLRMHLSARHDRALQMDA